MNSSMWFKGLVLGFALLCGQAAPLLFAQDIGPIASDRPGFGSGSALMVPGRFQVEAGYAYTELGPNRTHVIGQVLTRFGLSDRVELRVAPNSYLLVREDSANTSVLNNGFLDLLVGFKIGLIEGSGEPLGRPNLSLMAETTLPTSSGGLGANKVQPILTLLLDWPLSQAVGFSTNLAFFWLDGGDERLNNVFLTASLGFALPGIDGLGAYVGYLGSDVEKDGLSNFLEGGLTYLISPNTQVDISGGPGINGTTPDFFVGFGFSHRF